jgi:homoserine kinase
VVVRLSDKPGVTISTITGDNGVLSLDPEKNTAGVSVLALLQALKSHQGIEIELYKKMPMGSGLGSSAASAAASVFGVNALLGQPLSIQDLVPFAMIAEKMACGSAHADNVAPALLGGFILIRDYEPLDLIQIPLKQVLYCSVIYPNIDIRTEIARKILPNEITLAQMVTHTGNAAGLIAGLLQGDLALISRALKDVVVEPTRSSLIPGFGDIKSSAMAAGALGCSISGSGPSIFALSSDVDKAHVIGQAMQNACQAKGLGCELYVSQISQSGPKFI